MIRSELCAIAEITAPTFNSHRRNGDLPFNIALSEAQDGTGRTWSRFTIHDAARLIAARHLAASQGVTWSEAARIIRAQKTHGGEPGDPYNPEDHSAVHIAQVEFVSWASGAQVTKVVYQGTLSGIVAVAEARVQTITETHTEPLSVASMVSVNFSHCLEIARQRAAAHGITLGGNGEIDPAGEA